MKKPSTFCRRISGPIARRDLVTILEYVNRSGRSQRGIDGSFSRPEIHLDRLAAAARMQ
jgi:hypothetical protein